MGKLPLAGKQGVRTVLIEAAWTAVKYDPALSLKFSELRKRMESNEAIVSIARKLLSTHLCSLEKPY